MFKYLRFTYVIFGLMYISERNNIIIIQIKCIKYFHILKKKKKSTNIVYCNHMIIYNATVTYQLSKVCQL